MSASATFPDGTKQDVTNAPATNWSTGNTNTATVSPAGVVVGVNPGVTGITGELPGAPPVA